MSPDRTLKLQLSVITIESYPEKGVGSEWAMRSEHLQCLCPVLAATLITIVHLKKNIAVLLILGF